ncbi:MAG TPA: helix-turn-helix domain-containing protein [Alphaproteobacteria bacterium]|nr:helix-turn-helix domain-containing protein [Alphaproteobacteria bacterium]
MKSSDLKPADVPWRDREFLTMQTAGEIAGVSPASLYVLANRGEIALERFAGRTVVRPAELQRLLSRIAEPWKPSGRNRQAVQARAVVAA